MTQEVVFVAHDVGGSGGMERQSEQMVLGLLDRGWEVTVIARTCALCERDGLRFVRVPVPRAPATLAYPAFFLVASVLAWRRRALLHTTGAIVANRAEVSTVHYCHRAATARLTASRASRPSLPYQLNAAIASRLSLAGEWWCYRRARTHVLCAVSNGLASELREHFPPMATHVRTVPNGVDSSLFRPDPAGRADVRGQLGLDDAASLALFVGGDWERKGLRHAVEALAAAPAWHLAVAGHGDREPLTALAASVGTESRLHFLGSVRDMPPVYAAADAFVFPTAYEAFPLVALEAAASGLPLLVTRVNGVEDLLRDGENGWFIEQDCWNIARRLNALSSDRARAHQMAAQARSAGAAFSWEAMTDGYVALYSELSRLEVVSEPPREVGADEDRVGR